MLPWLIGTLVALYAAWKALSKYQALRLNVADAKRTGLPYVIVPLSRPLQDDGPNMRSLADDDRRRTGYSLSNDGG